MPFPKLSAVLNNCGLHALTPELTAEIVKFANNPLYQNNYNAQYGRLKDFFAEFYGFDKASFSWKTFAGILARYNPQDSQIILGPVLRLFMKQAMKDNDLTWSVAAAADKTRDQYIAQFTEVGTDGRYKSLAPDEVYSYIGKDLGLGIRYHKGSTGELFIGENPLATVVMYHQGGVEGAGSGGHWERTAQGKDSINYLEDAQLNKDFLSLFGEGPAINLAGFALLRKHVQLNARAVAEQGDVAEDFAELALTAAQIRKYLLNIGSVPRALAKELLGQPLTEETLDFIDRYRAFDEVPPNDIFERYIRAVQRGTAKPQVNKGELTIIIQLLEPVRKPEPPNYSFLLASSTLLNAKLSAQAFLTAALALAAIITAYATDALRAIGAKVVEATGLSAHGLFTSAANKDGGSASHEFEHRKTQ